MLSGSLGPPPGLLEDDLPPQEGYGLVINGEALGYALKKKYEKLFLEVGSLCSVSILFNTHNNHSMCLGSYLLPSNSVAEGTSCGLS